MRRFSVAALLLTLSVTTAHAQDALTREQRISYTIPWVKRGIPVLS